MDENLSPVQVKAARALLTWSQQDLAKQANVGASTVADFERGQRTPVANNSDAIRKSLEKAGIVFLPGGVVKGPKTPTARTARKGGQPVRWINATDLVQWADRRDSQAKMPELITRLIRAAVGSAAELDFPSDESVQLGGWDGTCIIDAGTDYIPDGSSGWEIGTQRDRITKKADDDYTKRTSDPLTLDKKSSTFVFVTPRRWTKKSKWSSERSAEKEWANVKAYDADDLVHWLELYPAVGHWLAVLMGKRPAGLRQLDEAWEEWSLSTVPPLSTDLTIAGRDEDAISILQWLRQTPSVLALQCESSDEAIAFLYAAISQLPEDRRLEYQARCLYASSPDAARMLGDSMSPLVIIIDSPDAGLAARLTERGHHVYAVYGSGQDVPRQTTKLKRPSRAAIKSSLETLAMKETDADRLARQSSRSLAVLRRLIPSVTAKVPKWAISPSRGLLSALLVGGWNEDFDSDKKALEKIAGMDYEAIIAQLAPLVGLLDSPIQKAGKTWKMASPRDAWFLLASNFTAEDFTRFETVTKEVYASIDPTVEVAPDERWMAGAKGVCPHYSELIRHGLGETLILFSLFGEQAPSVQTPDARVDYIVRQILSSTDRKVWWSISRDFTLLAEASPGAFLAGIEDCLKKSPSPITVLFGEEGGGIFGREHISSLLWALEILAWSPQYLARTALALAELDVLDPGGRFSNRPANSLRHIFLLWLPQTYVPLSQRLIVLDQILKIQPAVGWKLMINVFPKSHDSSDYSPHALWRDFSVDRKEEVTYQVIWKGADELTKRLLAAVGIDAKRWVQLIEILPNIEPTRRQDVVAQLTSTEPKIQSDDDRVLICKALRHLLHRHSAYPETDWALSGEELEPIRRAYAALQPKDILKRLAWLFGHNSQLPNPPQEKTEDEEQKFTHRWEAEQAEIVERRGEAVAAIISELGVNGIFQFAQIVERPDFIGVDIAKHPDIQGKDIILARALTEGGSINQRLSSGMIFLMNQRDGTTWTDGLFAQAAAAKWSPDIIAHILISLPAKRETWQRAATLGKKIDNLYWKQNGVFWIEGNVADIEYAIEKLIEVGRANRTIELIGHALHQRKLPNDKLMVKALFAAAKESPADAQGSDTTMLQHYVLEIFKVLEANGVIEPQEMAQLEWVYLSIFRFSNRSAIALETELATRPSFFVEILSTVYKPTKESGVEEPALTDTERARNMATQAYQLLDTWNRLPGMTEIGTVNESELKVWVDEARTLAEKAGRKDVADLAIGRMLSAAPKDSDGYWPIIAVRNVIEAISSRELERGISMGLYNSRGVTSRGMMDGGAQERDISDGYRKAAAWMALEWPRTSAMLDGMAKDYEREGRWRDDDAERNEWKY